MSSDRQHGLPGRLSEQRGRRSPAGLDRDASGDLAASIQSSVTEIAVMWLLHNWSRARERRAEPLDLRIENFSTTGLAAIAAHWPLLRHAKREYLWMIYFKGLLAAATHPHEQMIKAIKLVEERSRVQISGEPMTDRDAKRSPGQLSELELLEHITKALRQAAPGT